jgi:CSLREA domain-containing protein
MKSFSIKFLYSLTCAALLLALVGVQPAYAASYVVNTLTDENTSGDGLCSLREAIASANNSGNGDCGANSASADTITFNSGLSGGTITLSSSLPAINFDLTIDGSSLASQITISGANSYQITNVDPGVHATLDSLIFAHGNAPTGGGIFNEGILTINNSIFSDNRATGGNGGAIYNNSGTLTITGSTFSGNNHAETDGGALYINVGTVTISNSTFSSNTALNAAGGVYNAGTLTINNSTFSL